MKSSLTAYLAGIEELRNHLRGIRLENELLGAATGSPTPCSEADEVASKLKQTWGSGVAKRQFDYNTVIISLYGLVEHFVESLLSEYAIRLNTLVPIYDGLPEVLRKSHVEVSFTLLSRIEAGRYKGSTIEALIGNLNSCLTGAVPYRLNHEAFAQHTANFRIDVIDSTCARLGIGSISQRLRHFPPFDEYLENLAGGQDAAALTKDEMFATLNDLADRRNEVAHGEPSTLLSNEILQDYIEYVRVFGTALNEAFYCDSLGFEVAQAGVELGVPLAVYNKSIVCFELRDTSIRVGDLMVAKTQLPARPYLVSEILELQVNRVSMKEVPAQPAVQVGAKVAFHAKDNHSYVLLKNR